MSLKSKAIQGSFWQILNMGGFALQNFVFLMIMARIVPKEFHGVFALANILIVFISMIAESGTSAALIQRKDYNTSHLSIAFYLNVGVSIILYACLYLSAGMIVGFYDNKFSTTVLYVIGINLIVSNIGMVSYSLLIRDLNFKSICFINNITYFITHLVFGVYLASLGYGVWSFILPAVLFKFCKSISFFICRPHSLKMMFKKEESNEILYFGLSYTLVRILHYFSYQLDKLLLGKFIPLTALANYEKGQALTQLPGNILGNAFDPILFSVMTKIRDEKEKVSKLLGQIISVLTIILVYVSISIYIFTDSVILIVLGDNWLDAGPIMKVLAIIIPLQILVRISDILVRSYNKLFKVVPIKIFYICAILCCGWIASEYGLYIFTVCIAVSFFLYSLMMISAGLSVTSISGKVYLNFLNSPIKVLLILILKNGILWFLFNYFGVSSILHFPLMLILDLCLILIMYFFFRKTVLRIIDVDELFKMVAKRVFFKN